MKASLEPAFRLSRSHTLYGNAVLEAPPPLLAAEPPGTAFPASGWKRDLKRLLAKVDTYGHCRAPKGVRHVNENRYSFAHVVKVKEDEREQERTP